MSTNNLLDNINETLEETIDSFAEGYEVAQDPLKKVSKTVIKKTKEEPIIALGCAFAVGFLIAKILK